MPLPIPKWHRPLHGTQRLPLQEKAHCSSDRSCSEFSKTEDVTPKSLEMQKGIKIWGRGAFKTSRIEGKKTQSEKTGRGGAYLSKCS